MVKYGDGRVGLVTFCWDSTMSFCDNKRVGDWRIGGETVEKEIGVDTFVELCGYGGRVVS